MPATTATAPGKIILFGEHAVVYGQPAIAAPVTQVRAEAIVEDRDWAGVRLYAPDLGRDYWLAGAPEDDPFARAVRLVAEKTSLDPLPNLSITVRSNIPIASGLGSGAAMAAAVIRALTRHLGYPKLAIDEQVSTLTYQVEKLLHGTPSGIDNTVVAYERPVYFVRQQPQNRIETLTVKGSLSILVADTGVVSITKDVVGDVRRLWQAEQQRFERLFASCGQVAHAARKALENGDIGRLGQLMVQNQVYLREMTVSSPELERLIQAAMDAGALGAKLSGAGRGGNMIAIIEAECERTIREALVSSGATNVLTSVLT
jgi:mevalonate kinase